MPSTSTACDWGPTSGMSITINGLNYRLGDQVSGASFYIRMTANQQARFKAMNRNCNFHKVDR